MPLVTIIMPFHNAAGFLKQALESILNQTLNDFELILINDASSDDSEKEITDLIQDPRIKYIKNHYRQGIVYNLNKGLTLASADLVARMDGDDIAMPDRIQKQYDFLKTNPNVSVVGSFIQIIDDFGKVIDRRTKPTTDQEIKKSILTYSPLVHPSVMFRKSDILKVGGYRQDYGFNEDIDLWYRLVFAGFKMANLPEFLLQYRYHQNSTAHHARQNAKDLYRLRKDVIKENQLEITGSQKLMIILQFWAGFIFNGRQRQFIEKWYKILFYHAK